MLITSGKAYSKKHGLKFGNDHLAAYDKELVVWISKKDTLSADMVTVNKLEAQLTCKAAKVRPSQNSEGHEDTYWAGTEARLLGIP